MEERLDREEQPDQNLGSQWEGFTSVEKLDPNEERWRVIPGCESQYEVSDLGRVRAKRWRDVEYPEGKELTQTEHSNGYRKVTLDSRTRLVHDLVLRAFVGSPPMGFVARHLNGEPADNRLVNLVWGTRSENNRDTLKHGRGNTQKISEDEAWGIKLLLQLGNGGSQIREVYPAASTGMISCIQRGVTWKHLCVNSTP